MKILFINKEDNLGGTAQVAWKLAEELKDMGHQVRFIVRRKFSSKDSVYELKENPIFFFLRKIFNKDFTIVLSGLRDYLLSNDIDYGSEKEIINHPWVEWADVIHCHNLHGNYFKLANLIPLSQKRPVVWTLHDLWSVTGHCATPYGVKKSVNGFYPCPRLGDYQKLLWDNTPYLCSQKKSIYSLSDIILTTPSSWMKEKISHSVLSDKALSVIPNGVGLNVFKPLQGKENLRLSLGLPKDKKVILFFTYGWKNYSKGWSFINGIIDEYAQSDDVVFLGIGTKDDFEDKTRKVIYKKSSRDPKLLVKYYNCADVLLFPSLGESFGMVPLEAVACGLPVVAFPVGAIPDLVTHRLTGYIASFESIGDLKKGVHFTLGLDDVQRKKIATINSTLVKNHFSIESMAKSYASIYSTVKRNIRISIIVASLNNGGQLQKTIDSVYSQTYTNKELIIIDGGSSDSTREVINRNKSKISYWESKKDKGISDAFNKGVKRATGDYLLFLGVGDYLWNNQVLEKMAKNINPKMDLLVCGKVNRVSSSGSKVLYTTTLSFKKWQLLYKMGLPHQALLTNKRYFEKYGLFDIKLKYAMDYDLLLRSYDNFPAVIQKDIVVSAWKEGGVGTDKTFDVLSEYKKIRLNNRITHPWIIRIIDLASRLKYIIK